MVLRHDMARAAVRMASNASLHSSFLVLSHNLNPICKDR
jgi:hypothetical protein